MKNLPRVHIRWMIRRDMPEVMAMEQEETIKQKWKEEDYLHCLRQRNCIGMVAEQNERVIGHMVYELHPGYLYLMRMVVEEKSQRKGIASCMVQKLISKLSSHRRTMIEASVRESNLPAQLFLRSQRFKAESVERRWFRDTMEDAYIMRYRLDNGNLPAELPLSEDDPGCTITEEDNAVAKKQSEVLSVV